MVEISGGQNVEKYFRDLAQKLGRGGTLKVGFLSGATYPDGKSVALIAALNEFGTSRAPPRPFMRNVVATKSKDWGPSAGTILRQTNYDVKVTLEYLGIGIADQIRASITSNTPPPNAPSTIARKGFSRTLIDSGQMLQSVAYEVTVK